ncbi:pentapeptide repeat-containing protein [Streptomyces sp. NPDC002306]
MCLTRADLTGASLACADLTDASLARAPGRRPRAGWPGPGRPR